MRETHSKPTLSSTDTGLCSKRTEIRTHSPIDVRFYRIPFLLDLDLVRPIGYRWIKIQDTFNRISKKSVIRARTLMSTIGLLASTEKTVKLGRIHTRPFQWHLKVHLKFPMPLNSPIPWTQKMKQHWDWWLNP